VCERGRRRRGETVIKANARKIHIYNTLLMDQKIGNIIIEYSIVYSIEYSIEYGCKIGKQMLSVMQ